MALNLVPLVLDFYDGGGNLITSGTASLAPSSSLVDATDNVYVTQSPIVVNFHVGASPLVEVIPTDNANIEPGGWAWEITFNDVPGSPEPFYFNIAGSGTLFSFTAAGSVFTAAGSSFANGTGVVLQDELSLPGGFWPNTVYYVVDASGATFGLASGPGGDAIVSTSSGSGTVALVQYLSSVTTNLSPVTILPLPVSSGGTGAVNAAGARANLAVPQVFSPMSYDAAGNGITDDTEAVTAAFAAAAAAAGTVDLGTYTFLTSSPVSMPSNITVKAASGPGSASGGSIINSVSDIFEASGVLECFSFQNVTLIAAAGHIFNCAANTIAAFGTFLGCSFTQGAAGKSIWYMPSGVYLNMLVGDETSLTCNASATAVPWYVVGQANSNTWSSVRVTAGTSVTVPFFQIETDSASTWSSGNIFRDITAEICVAGIVKALTVSNLTLENVLGYDVSGSYNASLIYVGAGTGSLRSQDITARNCGRVGGSLAGGAYDFQAASSTQAILLENVGPESGSASYSVPAYYTTIVSAAGNYSNVQSGSLTASGTAQNSPAQARLIGGSTATGAPTAGTWDALDLHLDSAGVLRACTTAGTPGTWTAIGTPWISITDYGASTSSSDNGPAINAAITALPGGHGTIYVPPGTWDYTTQINLNGANNVRLVGSVAASGVTNTSLLYTGTGSAAAISATGSGAVCFENLFIEFGSASFSGYLIDYSGTSSDTALGIISGCYLGSAGVGVHAAALVCLNHANSMLIENCYLSGGLVGVLGMNAVSSYSNKITIDNCQFINNNVHIQNAAQAWMISNNTFEPCTGGTPGVYNQTYAGSNNLSFVNNWMGDITATSGSQIYWYGVGLVVEGNYIGSNTGVYGITIGANDCDAIYIAGNAFADGAGISFGATTGHTGVTIISNYFGIANPVSGTIPASAIIDVPEQGTGYGMAPNAAGVFQFAANTLQVGGITVATDTLASDIQPLGATPSAGGSGKFADAEHVHIAAIYGSNLLSNPDFASGTSGWSAGTNSGTALTNPPASFTQNATTSEDGSGTCGQVVSNTVTYYEGIWAQLTGLTANTTYIFYAYVEMTSGSQALGMICYDYTNGIVGTPINTTTPCPSTWTRLSATITTGSTGNATVYAAIRGNSTATSTWLVSAAFFGTVEPFALTTNNLSDLISAAAARSNLGLTPATWLAGGTMTGALSLGSTNLISNPDFASGTTGWNATASYFTNIPASFAQETGSSADGSGTCAQVVTNATSSVEGVYVGITPLLPNTTYTFIAYVQMTSGSQAIGMSLRDTTNAVNATTVTTVNPCPATWTQLTNTITTGSTGSVNIQASLHDTSAAACTFLISAVYFGTVSGIGQLAVANTWTAGQYVKSGRPWFDVDAFGADSTGNNDSTLAFNQCIAASLGGVYYNNLGYTASSTTVTNPSAQSSDLNKYINSPVFGANTTVASGSSGGEISAIASWSSPSAGVLDVASTSGFASSGTLTVVASGATLAVVAYTGTSGGNSFTGCTYISGSATGTVTTGNSVTTASGYSQITAVTSGVGYTVSTAANASLSAQSAFVGYNQTTGSAYALGPVHMNAGNYKISSDLNIVSVLGFHLIGSGATATNINSSGTNFTNAVIFINGSLDSTFENFAIAGTGTAPNAIYLTWNPSTAARSTSANTLRSIRVRNMNFTTGVRLAAIGGAYQVDGSTLIDVTVNGGQAINAWTTSGPWQYGFYIGNGISGNQYDHVMFNCSAGQCYYGYYNSASGYELFGAQPGANYCDFYEEGTVQQTRQGIQSQDSLIFVIGSGGSSTVLTAFRDIIWLGYPSAAPPSDYVINIAGGAAGWEFSNCEIAVASAYTPIVRLNGNGADVSATFINFRMENTYTSGFSIVGTASVVLVNYIDLTTSYTVSSMTPLAVYQAGAWSTPNQTPVMTIGEVAISSTTTMSSSDYSLMHACTVASAYTATLPTPVGATGQQIGVRIVNSSTNLLTLATAAGTIDGASTRTMWAGESATLESDGTNWVKIGGRTIPMTGMMTIAASTVTVATSTTTNLPLTTTLIDNTGLMCNTTNTYITAQRGGNYQVTARVAWPSLPGNSARTITAAYISGTSGNTAAQDERYSVSDGFPCIAAVGEVNLAASAYVTLSAYQQSGSTLTLTAGTSASPGNGTILSLTEIPAW